MFYLLPGVLLVIFIVLYLNNFYHIEPSEDALNNLISLSCHMTRIISTVVGSIIGIMFAGSIFFSSTFFSSPAMRRNEETPEKIAQFIDNRGEKEADEIMDLVKIHSDILLIKYSSRTLYSRYTDKQYKEDFGPGDFHYVQSGDTDVFFDLRFENAMNALPGMLLLLTIVFSVIVLMFVYSPHFAMTISDPVFVMLKGMRDENYNLEVEIPSRYGNDDIFKLSRLYNDKYLTLKAREDEDNSDRESIIKLEDLNDLLGDL